MRYGQRGGYTPAEQQRRERLRLEAAMRFAAGDGTGVIARELRVTPGSVRRWRRAGREGIRRRRYNAVNIWSRELFTIDDDTRTPQFEVRRIYGRSGSSLSLRNLDGRQLAAIRPDTSPARFSPTHFEIEMGGGHPITVRNQGWGWFGRKYSTTGGGDEMSATVGLYSEANYQLISPGTVRATVSQQVIQHKDIVIDVADGENAVSLIAVVLAIEILRDDRRIRLNPRWWWPHSPWAY
jgi:uncharacterized protein YxjI